MLQGGHRIIGTTQALGGDGAGRTDSIPLNARQAALDAAERRKQTEHRRGTNEANPNAGQLAGQLAAKNASRGSEPQQPERLVWD